MNFFRGRFQTRQEGACFQMTPGDGRPGLSLPLKNWAHPPAPPWPEQEVILGLRPEDVVCVRAGVMAGGSAEAMLERVEPLGAETCLYLKAEGESIVARMTGLPAYRVGEVLRVQLDANGAVLFDAATGVRIS